jgi:hypothetical protein
MDRKVGGLDECVRPNPIHQVLLANQLSWSFQQHTQDLQSSTPDAYRPAQFEQKKLCRKQAERRECNLTRYRNGMFGAISWYLACIQTVRGSSRANPPVRPKSCQT